MSVRGRARVGQEVGREGCGPHVPSPSRGHPPPPGEEATSCSRAPSAPSPARGVDRDLGPRRPHGLGGGASGVWPSRGPPPDPLRAPPLAPRLVSRRAASFPVRRWGCLPRRPPGPLPKNALASRTPPPTPGPAPDPLPRGGGGRRAVSPRSGRRARGARRVGMRGRRGPGGGRPGSCVRAAAGP